MGHLPERCMLERRSGLRPERKLRRDEERSAAWDFIRYAGGRARRLWAGRAGPPLPWPAVARRNRRVRARSRTPAHLGSVSGSPFHGYGGVAEERRLRHVGDAFRGSRPLPRRATLSNAEERPA